MRGLLRFIFLATLIATLGFAFLPDNSLAEEESAIIATFDVNGEKFKVLVRNPATIVQILDLKEGKSTASIPNGKILPGAGEMNHNAPYSWHLDPQDISMADFTIELCDGTPSYVEDNVKYFIEKVGRYCPWSAKLVSVEYVKGSQGTAPKLPNSGAGSMYEPRENDVTGSMLAASILILAGSTIYCIRKFLA